MTHSTPPPQVTASIPSTDVKENMLYPFFTYVNLNIWEHQSNQELPRNFKIFRSIFVPEDRFRSNELITLY